MTKKIAITRKELANLPKDELLAILRESEKIKEAAKYRTLDSYYETAHEKQIEFSKAASKHRMRFFLGGNRCLIDSTLLKTMDGERAIADILEPTFYVSLNEAQNKFQLSLGSAPFPKAKENLYRVIHEQGEFVGSAEHLVFCADRAYRRIGSLSQGDLIVGSQSQRKTNSEFYQKESLSDASHLMKKLEDYRDRCAALFRRYDQQLRLAEDFCRYNIRQRGDALKFYQLLDHAHIYHKDALAVLLLERIHRDQVTDLIYSENCLSLLKVQSFDEFSNPLSIDSFEHTLDCSQSFLQSAQKFLIHQKDLLSSKANNHGFEVSPFYDEILLPPTNSKIIKIEKLGRSDWIWDLSVPGNNNYVGNGIVHHNSGKSTAGFVEDILLATGKHPFMKKWKTPCKGLVVVQDFETHGKNILEPKFDEWCPKGDIVKIDRNQTGAIKKIYFKCGSIIDVASHDQDIKVFEGTDYDFVHFDEPPPRRIFVAVWRGLTDRGGLLYMTATPLMSPWLYKIYKKFLSGDKLIWFEMVKTTENAKNIGEGNAELGLKRIEEFASALDEDEKAARLDGEMAQMRGIIFKSWDPTHHLIRPFAIPAHWKIYESIDPHPQKAWGVSWTAEADSGQKILLRSEYIEGDIEDIASQIIFGRSQLQIQGNNNPRIVRCLIDNYASVPLWQKSNTDPTAERLSVRQELENYIGPSVGGPIVEVAPKNIAQKIELFKGWLKIRDNLEGGVESHFYVFDTPENEAFTQEIEEFVWDESKDHKLKDKPKKINDDILDTLMQLALTLPKDREEIDFTPIKVMEHRSWTVR